MSDDVYCARCVRVIPWFTPCYFYGDDFICPMCNDKRKTSTVTKERVANDCEESADDDS